ncbi:MAG: GTP 3',8-cyclase MoaA [Defluviitaleaceae bacterium]|nr:GTP 3',8-cyclase MoaA [Defluviitaleaceae bacterium]
MSLSDRFARKIDYMRVSITDRCNLRCAYCMPEDVECIRHENVLRFEEYLRLFEILAELGIKYVRVTGGEPLVRKGWLDFVKALKVINGIERVTITTNAVLLEQHLDELAKIGLDGLNISLDTLDPQTYHKITGFDVFGQVWSSINKAVELGLKVKLNCVPIKGVNDGEILKMVTLPRTLPIDMRFIELMPTSVSGDLEGVATEDILEAVKMEYPHLAGDDTIRGFGPARYYKTPDMLGSLGFISPISHEFCSGCNRIRLSSDGFLTLCLHHSVGLDLRGLLRGGAGNAEISSAIVEAVNNKPERHHIGEEIGLKHMSKIGG